LAELEAHFDVFVITQNVDDLHERAGSNNVLHGNELLKVRSNATKLHSRLAGRFEFGDF
jgi:NAD-dependent deacetylase